MRTLWVMLGFVVWVAGCYPNTRIEESWRAPTTSMGELRKVVTLVRADDGVIRRKTEEQLAHQLRQSGVQASPGYAVLAEDQRDDHEGMIAALRQQGFDGVISIRYLGAEEDLEVYPSFNSYWGGGFGGYGGYYGGYYGGWGGYDVYPEVVHRVESNAYRLSDGQLVYSVISRTENPEDLEEIIRETTEVVARDLTQRAIVAPTAISSR